MVQNKPDAELEKTYRDFLAALGEGGTNIFLDNLKNRFDEHLDHALSYLIPNYKPAGDVQFKLTYLDNLDKPNKYWFEQFMVKTGLGTLELSPSAPFDHVSEINYTFNVESSSAKLYSVLCGLNKIHKIKGFGKTIEKYKKYQKRMIALPFKTSDMEDLALDILEFCLKKITELLSKACEEKNLGQDDVIAINHKFIAMYDIFDYFEIHFPNYKKDGKNPSSYLIEQVLNYIKLFGASADYTIETKNSSDVTLTCNTSLNQLKNNIEAFTRNYRIVNIRAKCKDRSYVLELLHRIIAEHPFMVKFLNGEEFNDQLIGMSQPEGKEVKRLAEVAVEKYGNNPTYHFALDCDDARKQAIINYFNAILKSDDERPIGKVTEENGFIVIRISDFLALIDAYHKEKKASCRFEHIRSEEDAKVDEHYKKHPDQERKVKPLTLTKLDIPPKIYYGEYYK